MKSQPPSAAQHYLNPLHVYCRLRDMGLPTPVARSISAGYERVLYRPASSQDANATQKTGR